MLKFTKNFFSFPPSVINIEHNNYEWIKTYKIPYQLYKNIALDLEKLRQVPNIAPFTESSVTKELGTRIGSDRCF